MTDAPSRILPYINTMVNSVTYEVNHQRIWIQRVDYGIFEWLSDVGGIRGALYGFFGTILMLFFVGDGDQLAIASQLTDMTVNTSADRGDTDGSSIIHNCCLMTKIKLSNPLTRFLCFCCCKRNRLEDRIKIGQSIVQKELDISFLLKRLRVLEGIAKEKLSATQWIIKWRTYEKVKLDGRNSPHPVDLSNSGMYLQDDTIEKDSPNADRQQIPNMTNSDKAMSKSSSAAYLKSTIDAQLKGGI